MYKVMVKGKLSMCLTKYIIKMYLCLIKHHAKNMYGRWRCNSIHS